MDQNTSLLSAESDKETHFRGLDALRRDRLTEARAAKIAAGVQCALLDMSLKDALLVTTAQLDAASKKFT
jgi:hypothetical protein